MLVDKIKDKIKRMYESGEYEFILGKYNDEITIQRKDITDAIQFYDNIYLTRSTKNEKTRLADVLDMPYKEEAKFPFYYIFNIMGERPNLFQEEMEDVYNFILSIIERCEHNNENRGMNRNMIEWLES